MTMNRRKSEWKLYGRLNGGKFILVGRGTAAAVERERDYRQTLAAWSDLIVRHDSQGRPTVGGGT